MTISNRESLAIVMSNVLALIPARSGSKGIPRKNFRLIDGRSSPTQLAVDCARAVTEHIVVSCDIPLDFRDAPCPMYQPFFRPPALAQDDTPMIDVVQHALREIPGPEEQIIVLVQPTQPLREPKHLTAAIDLLRETQADSVVSVVELPLTHSPDAQVVIRGGRLEPYVKVTGPEDWWSRVYMRQHYEQTWVRDGTCYCFYRRTVNLFGNIYGHDCRPLFVPASESCPLDTEDDWREAERRLRDREAMQPLR